ncbi:hypothetical protein [Idiomarina sp.]|uniref:hypothetical protein n=1 Tax=Idiomarina sp. TaxID=1874361 RepID=UPI001D9A6612|nr:hypothetical protein [Idiomarina sp.]MCJ8315447.1 hypothetical protein [Idiomarina sp.]NQZ15362.1 hypothetical protein [Idiomarina sp.]
MSAASAFEAVLAVCDVLHREGVAFSLCNGTSLMIDDESKTSKDLVEKLKQLQSLEGLSFECSTDEEDFHQVSSFVDSNPEFIYSLSITWRNSVYNGTKFYIFMDECSAVETFKDKAVQNKFRLPENIFVFSVIKTWNLEEFKQAQKRNADSQLSKLNNIFAWFELLSIAANVKPKGHSDSNELIFVQKIDEEASSKPYHLDLELPENLAGIPHVPELDGSLRKTFIDETSSPHIKERIGFLRVAIVSLIFEALKRSDSRCESVTSYICNSFDKLTEKYHINYEAFLENLSASKLLKDLEEAELEYNSKINSAISDAQSKAFAVPAVFVAMALLARVSGTPAMILLTCSAVFTGLIIHFTISSQQAHLKRIKKSIFRYFDKVKYEDDDDQEKFSKRIKNSKRELLSEISNKQRSFSCLLAVGWAPTIVAILYVVFATFVADTSINESPKVIILPVKNI